MASVGTSLGPYEILGTIGAGGMGEVYRARDVRLGREVAIKLVRPELLADAVSARKLASCPRSRIPTSPPCSSSSPKVASISW